MSACIGSASRLRLSGLLERRAHLLVVGGDGRDVLIVQLLGDGPHRVGTVFAETQLPHPQGEGDVVGRLSRKVWDHRRLASAPGAVAIVAMQPVWSAGLGELLAALDECRAGRC